MTDVDERVTERPYLGTGQWVIYRSDAPWWDVPYCVFTPAGSLHSCSWTLWGARRSLRRAKAAEAQRAATGSRRYVVVHEEDPSDR